MKKKVLSLLLAAGMVLAMLTGCGGGDASGTPSGSGGGDGTYKVALLIAGTLGDKSFWDSANDGLASLKAELGDEFEYKVEQMGGGAADQANYEPTILDYCDSGEYDVIVTGSFTMVDALSSAVEQFPDQKFILFDEAYDFEANGNPDNLYNILFKQNEVSYLVGAEASMLSKSGAICFLGGMAGKVINDFLMGYIQGARDSNSDIKIAVRDRKSVV